MTDLSYVNEIYWKRTLRRRIEEWLAGVEEPYEFQATPLGNTQMKPTQLLLTDLTRLPNSGDSGHTASWSG